MSAEYDARFVTYIPKRRRIIKISLAFALLVGIYALSWTLLLQTRGDDYNDEVDSRHMDTPGKSRDFLVGDRFRRRKDHLKQYCKNLSLNELGNKYDVTSHLIIDERRHLVYCFIEKIGCTFWLRVFQILNGFKNVTDPYQTRGMEAYGGFKTAQNIPFHTLNHIFTQSMKFLFVREPFGRLLSGYVDKMFLPTVPYWLNLERFIIEKFRQKNSVSRTKCGKAVTFAEFVEYFLYSEQTNDRTDMHFSLSFDHCRPCELDYDYIGKLETFEEDTTYILKEMKLNKTIEIKNFMEKSEKDAITLEIDWIYGVEKSVDDCIPRSERIFRAYRKLQIRGLISKDIPFPFSNETAMSVGIGELKQVFLDIHARSGPPEVRRTNRKEAFLEAYSSLPRDLLTRLQEQLKLDAELFGYDVYPDILKHAEGYNPQFSFFGTVHNN